MERPASRLDAVVRADRRRVDAVLAEARRVSERSAVTHDLAVDVIATVHTHLDVIDQVLDAVDVDRGISGRRVREALVHYEASLESDELEDLRETWRRDSVAVDGAIARIRAERGDRLLARLGHDFRDQLEAHDFCRPRAAR